jgi:hypothetical protein
VGVGDSYRGKMRHRESVLHVVLLLAALLACGKKSKSDSSSDSPAQAESATPVAATDLMADYKANEVRGDAKWKGKLVRVTGVIGDIKKDFMDHPYVTLGSGAPFEIPEIQCSLKDGQEGAAAGLTKGTKGTFRGRVKGLILNVLVDDCELVPTAAAAAPAAAGTQAQPSPRPAATGPARLAPPPPPKRR